MSDEPLSVCPSCGTTGYAKQLSAAGFQLKGSGWYATDFKGGATAAAASTAAPEAAKAESNSSAKADSGTAASGGTACGGSCTCH